MPIGGVARRATLIKQNRAQYSNTLVLDAGNSLIGDQGTAVNTQGQSSVEVMNLMGYDAMALGEGDLAKLGLSVLRQRVQEAHFDILSANAVLSPTGELLLKPYLIREFNGHHVAIIGLTGPITTSEVIVRDPLETARQIVGEVKKQAEIIILLSHGDLNTSLQIANEIPEIDLVISGGGQSNTMQPANTTDGRAILHPDVPTAGHAGRRVGVGMWTFNMQGQPANFTWQNRPLSPDIADDPEFSVWMQQHP